MLELGRAGENTEKLIWKQQIGRVGTIAKKGKLGQLLAKWVGRSDLSSTDGRDVDRQLENGGVLKNLKRDTLTKFGNRKSLQIM